jgi:hypothetical protein
LNVDRLTHFVRVAHLKMRVQYLPRRPEILERIMTEKRPSLYIPKPIELAGMRARLLRSKKQEKDLAETGRRYDEVMDGIDEAHVALRGHVGSLEYVENDVRKTIEGMLERSNRPPPDGESDGRQLSSDQDEEGAPGDAKPDAAAPGDQPPPTGASTDEEIVTAADVGSLSPDQLTVNGVAKQP